MAEDRWESQLFTASFAGLELDVLSTDDDASRAVAVHSYPYRNGGRVEDVGGEPRSTRCAVVFFQRDPDDDHLARFKAFEELKRQGVAGTFTHPLTGSYTAKIGAWSFRAEAEPRDVVHVDVTFIEDSDEPATFDIGAGAPLQGGAEVVATAAATLPAAGADPQTIAVGTDAVAAARSWEDPDVGKTLREVNLEVVGLHNRIEAELSRLEVATDIKRYPLLRSLSALERSLRRCAEVFTERTPRIVEVTLAAPTNLLTLVTRRFGAAQASDRYDELRRLNDIRNPARIEAGTVLKMQSDAAPRRLRSQR